VTFGDVILLRWKIPDRRSVPAVIRSLEAERIVLAAQPNYLYGLQGAALPPAEKPPAATRGATSRAVQRSSHSAASNAGLPGAVGAPPVNDQDIEIAGSFPCEGRAVVAARRQFQNFSPRPEIGLNLFPACGD